MSDTVSACCHAEIKAYMPHVSFYSQSPPDPVPYCTVCEQTNPEEIDSEEVEDSENRLCRVCEGRGFDFDDGEYDPGTKRCAGGRRRTCGHCHGTGVEPEEEEDDE